MPQAPAEPTSFRFSFSAQRAPPAAATSSSAFSKTPPAASATTPAEPSSISSESPALDHRFRIFRCVHGDCCGDGACNFSLRRVVRPNGCRQRSDQQLPRPCAYTRGAGTHVRRRRPFGVPHTTVVASQHLLKGVTTETLVGAVTDNNGNDRRVSFRVVLVPDLGTNLFSVTAAMQQRVATLIYPASPKFESGDVVIPMQSCGVDDATGKLMCSIEVKLGGGAGDQMVLGRTPDGLTLKSESAELWHRRIGHINHKSLDVLRKEPASGVDYTGDLKNSSTCPPGKSAQQP